MSTNAPNTDAMIKQLATEYAYQIIFQIRTKSIEWHRDHDFSNTKRVLVVYQLLSTDGIQLKDFTLPELKESFKYYLWCLERRVYMAADDTIEKAMTDLCLFMEVGINCKRRGLRIAETCRSVAYYRRIMTGVESSPELQELFERSIGRRRQQSIPATAS